MMKNRGVIATVLLLTMLVLLPVAGQSATVGCSAYQGQVKINEVRISSSGSSSTSNRIELFNSGNVSPSIWQKWQLVVYYKRSSGGTASKKGGYYLSTGFTASGQFIYNNNKAIYLRNRNSRYVDIALVDQNGNFIDYVALEGKVQTVPSCMGTVAIVNVTASDDRQGDVPRLPDGGSWPASVTNSSLNTIGRTNVCTTSGSDLFVSNVADSSNLVVNPLVTVTPVTYSIDVRNVSCSNGISNITLTDTNISATNFSNLSYTMTQGSVTQGSSSLLWNVSSLNAGASATLTVTGTPKNVGVLTTTASITTPSSGLVNTGDDSDAETITVRDFNYVGFDIDSDTVVEGTDTAYSASIGSMVVASQPITVNYTVSGTATSGDTNLSSSGSVVINPTDSISPNAASIDFTIKNDSIYESTKTIILTITSISSADGAVKLDSGAQTMVITLNDDDHPDLVAEYRMDETGWGGISGEVGDSSGYLHDGTAAGASGIPNVGWTTPAKSGNPGTCAYGAFSGGSTRQSVDMGAADLGLGGQAGVTVAAWVRWTINPATGNPRAVIVSNNATSSEDVGQFWLEHSETNDHFEFAVKTSSTRARLFSNTQPVLNQWYHLVGIYDGTKLAIYVNGALENTTALTGTVALFNAYPLNIGRWGFSGNNYRAFQGNIDEVKIFNGPITAAQVTDLYNETHVCPVYSNGATPSYFNCVEVGAAANTNLYTKLASNAFNLDVVAVKADGSLETGYVGTTDKNVTLELVDGAGSTACASRSVLSSGLTQTVSFAAGNNGRKTVAIGPVNYAYADVRCRVTDTNQTPSMTGCSTDHFAIRPSTLAVTSSAGADATGHNATATPIVKAGGNFSLTATSDVLGYAGTPKLDTSKLAAHSGAVQNGVLSGSFNSADATTGVAANSNFTYSEVGYFALGAYGVYDDGFAGVDSADGDCTSDFSNTAVGGKYGCKFGNTGQTGYFGRFIPDHLLTQILSNGSFAHACSTFSYNGQTLNYATGNHPMLDVYAYNAATPAAVTKNYTGGFARLQASQFVLTAPTSDAVQKGADNSTLLKLTASLAGPSLTDNGNGNLTLVLGNDGFTYQREANALIAPFGNAVGITVASVADSDGVTAGSLPMVLQPSGENIRYGRVNLMNGYGSELTDLAVPMTAEYYNGKSFVTNPDDRCSVATITVADPLPGDSLQTSDSCIWDNGGLSGSAKCGGTAPSGESYGESSGLSSGSFNLYLKAPGKTGSLTVNATVANWLMFNWQGAGAANPSATASFGLYKGNSRQIYLREVY